MKSKKEQLAVDKACGEIVDSFGTLIAWAFFILIPVAIVLTIIDFFK